MVLKLETTKVSLCRFDTKCKKYTDFVGAELEKGSNTLSGCFGMSCRLQI
jgi:hypothetical protein